DGATTDEGDAHLVRPDGLTAGEVVVPAPNIFRGPVVRWKLQAGARPAAVRIHWRARVWLRVGSLRRGHGPGHHAGPWRLFPCFRWCSIFRVQCSYEVRWLVVEVIYFFRQRNLMAKPKPHRLAVFCFM